MSELERIGREIIIFTDGACSGNPGPGGWGAVIATPAGEIKELGGGARATTNNKMELLATIQALIALRGTPGKVCLYTDSVYVIKGITEWIHGWRRRGWKNAEGQDVANREYWEDLSKVVEGRGRGGIDWRYVRGHTGVPGNERCDEIAVAFTQGRKPKLYSGPLTGYDVDIYALPPDQGLPERSSPAKAPTKAHSYLSLVDGVPMRHATWAECERRVKGRSGARFKKTTSPDDESRILSDWGVRL